jgi:hypothetical protein
MYGQEKMMSKRYELGVFVRVYGDIDSFDSYEQVRDEAMKHRDRLQSADPEREYHFEVTELGEDDEV